MSLKEGGPCVEGGVSLKEDSPGVEGGVVMDHVALKEMKEVEETGLNAL